MHVRQNGRGDFKTLTEAINSVPVGNKERVIIKLGHGEYKEKVTIDRNKPFITLYGNPNAMPVLTFDGTAVEYGTVDSATLIVLSDYFMAINIIVKVAYVINPRFIIVTLKIILLQCRMEKRKEQALSMRISGNKATFYNCKLYGYQDTICDDTGNHFFKDCYIEGTFDFIFGSGRSLYLSTQLNVVGDGLRVITAHAGKSTEEKSGYSFVHCKVTGTGTGIYLVLLTRLDGIEKPQTERDNRTVFYGEYKCSGPGSRKEKKVKYTQDIDNI
ncbi:unnamed protein product [Brassica napus]|uniref:pectinesterase n=1 Tax=Brassica napus TaxID=3708 RepID=A0A816Y076_BRANA|nr:unnamed protein product [Brassica napus]